MSIDLGTLLVISLQGATPLLLLALGGWVSMQAGILDVGLEGKLIAGAFVGVIVSMATGSGAVGLAASALAGAGVAYAAWLCQRYLDTDVVVTGLAVNMVVAAGITLVMRATFDVRGSLHSDRIAAINPLAIPGWISTSPIPLPNLIDLLAPVAVVGLGWLILRTRSGLRLRACGQGDGSVAQVIGLNVRAWQGCAMVLGGALAGIAGGYLSLALARSFVEGMGAGRGFIAVAIILLAGRSVTALVAWAYLLGSLFALQSMPGLSGIPPQWLHLMPFLAALLVVLGQRLFKQMGR